MIDFSTVKTIEEALLDQGLAKAMEDIYDDEELTLSEAIGLNN